ncbi:MAG: DNA polymerase III subunit gamma/tau, partial [Dehalococcoidia bacterium]
MTGQAITDPATATQVFYRKWRPTNFSQLVGQEHVSTTLRQALRQGRVSHSYLFCGPRGSGKTTTARIIAKAVNCLDIQDGDPCDACTNCRSVNGGQFMDIIELDAASNRGIDEIRDIREKVNFAPAQGKRKVYIIDEAHMLTDAASNAFLKTLEEPPPHVIFVLCTTEAHRILPTIISRC